MEKKNLFLLLLIVDCKIAADCLEIFDLGLKQQI